MGRSIKVLALVIALSGAGFVDAGQAELRPKRIGSLDDTYVFLRFKSRQMPVDEVTPGCWNGQPIFVWDATTEHGQRMWDLVLSATRDGKRVTVFWDEVACDDRLGTSLKPNTIWLVN